MPLFGRRDRSTGTRIFYATDVHGSERTWRKFLNAGAFYKADVLVMGGDVMGKLAIPIIRESDGRHRATIHGRVERLETDAEVEAVRERIADLGFYDTTIDEDDYRALRDDPAAVEQLFVRPGHRAPRWRWIELAEIAPRGRPGIRCYATGGNDDVPEVMATMARVEARSFIACEDRVVAARRPAHHGQHAVRQPDALADTARGPRAGAGGQDRRPSRRRSVTTATPSSTSTLHPRTRRSTPARCSTGRRTRRPRSWPAASRSSTAPGAQAVRAAIERYQPMLGLHGHIHESQAAARIGSTLCINPGSEYGEGVLRGCLITISGRQGDGLPDDGRLGEEVRPQST